MKKENTVMTKISLTRTQCYMYSSLFTITGSQKKKKKTSKSESNNLTKYK